MRRQNSINWTSQEVLTLVNEEVENSPNNLSRAFENIAYRMNTTTSNVAKAWYRSLKFNIKGFTVKSKNVKVVNTKNERRGDKKWQVDIKSYGRFL
jgi:hypothetical protein